MEKKYIVLVSEESLLHSLLRSYIESIQSGEIYDHGYPERRLIPSDHVEQCQESFLETVIEDITDKVSNIIREYF